ncbi:MAG: hypothetical protein MJ078_05995 [Clostridia bacterium]|nr:hypothetical protein [Clostridia bacterium]
MIFHISGKDARFAELRELISKHGFAVSDAPFGEGINVFPVIAPDPEFLPVIASLPERSRILFGKATENERSLCKKRGIRFSELFSSPDYLAENGAATAAGVLCEALSLFPYELSGAKVLICGYGNCGAPSARILRASGCRVTVFSHEGSLRRAASDGFSVLHGIGGANDFGLIINTVPGAVFDPPEKHIKKGTVFLQVASGDAAKNPAAFGANGIDYFRLPGLPAKYAPKSEARAIFAELRKLTL